MWKEKRQKVYICQLNSGTADDDPVLKLLKGGLNSPFLLRLLIKVVKQPSYHSMVNDNG